MSSIKESPAGQALHRIGRKITEEKFTALRKQSEVNCSRDKIETNLPCNPLQEVKKSFHNILTMSKLYRIRQHCGF